MTEPFLADTVLCHVFSFLPEGDLNSAVTLTCKRWCHLSRRFFKRSTVTLRMSDVDMLRVSSPARLLSDVYSSIDTLVLVLRRPLSVAETWTLLSSHPRKVRIIEHNFSSRNQGTDVPLHCVILSTAVDIRDDDDDAAARDAPPCEMVTRLLFGGKTIKAYPSRGCLTALDLSKCMSVDDATVEAIVNETAALELIDI